MRKGGRGPAFRTRRRISQLNKYAGKPFHLKDMSDAGFEGFTWPRLKVAKGVTSLQMLRSWRCVERDKVCRAKRDAKQHKCICADCGPPLAANERVQQLQATKEWATANCQVHGVSEEVLLSTFDCAEQVLKGDPGYCDD